MRRCCMDPGHGNQAAGRLNWLGCLSSQLLSPHPQIHCLSLPSPLPLLLIHTSPAVPIYLCLCWALYAPAQMVSKQMSDWKGYGRGDRKASPQLGLHQGSTEEARAMVHPPVVGGVLGEPGPSPVRVRLDIPFSMSICGVPALCQAPC